MTFFHLLAQVETVEDYNFINYIMAKYLNNECLFSPINDITFFLCYEDLETFKDIIIRNK